jgi:hypothetical protein
VKPFEERLREARKNAEAIPYPKTRAEYEQWEAARSKVLEIEREAALARNEECALKWDLPLLLHPVATPTLISDAFRSILLVPLKQKEAWAEALKSYAEWATFDDAPYATLDFDLCHVATLGYPNDEALWGHPLQGKGMESYSAHIIENSRWKAELEVINKAHPNHNPEQWRKLKHFFISFHDCTFQCLAEDYKVSKTSEPYGHLISQIMTTPSDDE